MPEAQPGAEMIGVEAVDIVVAVVGVVVVVVVTHTDVVDQGDQEGEYNITPCSLSSAGLEKM